MSAEKLLPILHQHVESLKAQGIAKSRESIIAAFIAGENGLGPRVELQDHPGRKFLRMNSNSYLGLGRHRQVIAAESGAVERYGAGPGAVRFISGTFRPHVELEQRLADFHGREAGMLFSAAYAAMIGVLPALIDENTLVVSDELNHNCIIKALRLAKLGQKAVYPHLDMAALERILIENKGRFKRVCVVSDGVFSMRGDHAPLDQIDHCCQSHQHGYEQGVITVIDDSHGVGAFGLQGRGTEEVTGARADILVATLGKAFGINGGYVVASEGVIDYLRETAASYIYSNPITPAEAAAALAAVDIIDSEEGGRLLQSLRSMTARLRSGIVQAGFATLPGEHPVVPILIRDTAKTSALVQHLFARDILVTGLNYPVVAKGEQEIRVQVCAEHTIKDIGYFVAALQDFSGG
ncbi:aminotransferase class I/II-fold pyridoxal phosphate-dependent enzyme [Methylomarinum sp. Ch1-1]|uniref:Aminotransferase class I/II-fold pyridoxal phosphate-dependent enzyme n=1 Tax=Methylomarinum roseum TaxID=3067653 RepID=A0AAU7NZC7_9GAMM|nr:aminotransferase class I/II-fold pyridoxal phosphate-dependent enzyme [Methylomarinum sp. Ch1-1]MDP4521581.1 aminotransferase class I/II-fold pyridoxal phosphate-dependent enzyme [Methylomarinum sp. Ch1-1]